MYTVKTDTKNFEFSELEGKEIMTQIFGQYFDVRKNLLDRSIKADEKTIEAIEKNLFDEVLNDADFWDVLDRAIDNLNKRTFKLRLTSDRDKDHIVKVEAASEDEAIRIGYGIDSGYGFPDDVEVID